MYIYIYIYIYREERLPRRAVPPGEGRRRPGARHGRRLPAVHLGDAGAERVEAVICMCMLYIYIYTYIHVYTYVYTCVYTYIYI